MMQREEPTWSRQENPVDKMLGNHYREKGMVAVSPCREMLGWSATSNLSLSYQRIIVEPHDRPSSEQTEEGDDVKLHQSPYTRATNVPAMVASGLLHSDVDANLKSQSVRLGVRNRPAEVGIASNRDQNAAVNTFLAFVHVRHTARVDSPEAGNSLT